MLVPVQNQSKGQCATRLTQTHHVFADMTHPSSDGIYYNTFAASFQVTNLGANVEVITAVSASYKNSEGQVRMTVSSSYERSCSITVGLFLSSIFTCVFYTLPSKIFMWYGKWVRCGVRKGTRKSHYHWNWENRDGTNFEVLVVSHCMHLALDRILTLVTYDMYTHTRHIVIGITALHECNILYPKLHNVTA